MSQTFNRWKKLFLFCLGLSLAASFAMKWIEPDMIYKNEKISIFGLELFYPKEKIIEIFLGISDKVQTIIGYHLSFDFIFMAGIFPGIACLCMMAISKVKSNAFRKILFAFACLQLFAWTFDIIENFYLLKWLEKPVIGNEIGFFHAVVYSKWIIALSAALISIAVHVSLMFKKLKLKSIN